MRFVFAPGEKWRVETHEGHHYLVSPSGNVLREGPKSNLKTAAEFHNRNEEIQRQLKEAKQ